MKKILVIGGSGFVGRHLGIANPALRFLKTYNRSRTAEGIHFDLEKPRLAEALGNDQGFSHVMLLAGLINFGQINKDPARARYINVDCTKKVIDQIIDLGLCPLYFSSESVFDGKKGGYLESDAPNPLFHYAEHKVEIEAYIQHKTRNFLILRLSKVFSSDFTDNTLCSSWLRQLTKDEVINVADDNIFCPIHIDDLTQLIERLIEYDANGIYHCSSADAYSRTEMLGFVQREFEKFRHFKGQINRCSLHDFPGAESYPLNTSLNPRKVMEKTGIHPRSFAWWAEHLTREYGENYSADGSPRTGKNGRL